jgi:hypothetical protein
MGRRGDDGKSRLWCKRERASRREGQYQMLFYETSNAGLCPRRILTYPDRLTLQDGRCSGNRSTAIHSHKLAAANQDGTTFFLAVRPHHPFRGAALMHLALIMMSNQRTDLPPLNRNICPVIRLTTYLLDSGEIRGYICATLLYHRSTTLLEMGRLCSAEP